MTGEIWLITENSSSSMILGISTLQKEVGKSQGAMPQLTQSCSLAEGWCWLLLQRTYFKISKFI